MPLIAAMIHLATWYYGYFLNKNKFIPVSKARLVHHHSFDLLLNGLSAVTLAFPCFYGFHELSLGLFQNTTH